MWQDVYLRDVSQTPSPTEMPIYDLPVYHTCSSPIRIPEHLVSRVAAKLAPQGKTGTFLKVINGSLPWNGDSPMTIELSNWTRRSSPWGRRVSYGHICLVLGRCTEVQTRTSQLPHAGGQSPGSLWANIVCCEWKPVDVDSKLEVTQDAVIRKLEATRAGHQCPDDHILFWSGLEKSFDVTTPQRTTTLTLVFTLRNSTLTLRRLEMTQLASRSPP